MKKTNERIGKRRKKRRIENMSAKRKPILEKRLRRSHDKRYTENIELRNKRKERTRARDVRETWGEAIGNRIAGQ